MLNYQRLYYEHYYKMFPNGNWKKITRRECFAPGKEPTSNCPFIQRWSYDPEASYAIRLPRNPLGEKLGKRNAADRKKEERAVLSDTEHTGIELDKPIDGGEVYVELADETADVYAIAEDRAELDALFSLLDRLSGDDRELWNLMAAKAKKQEIADRFGITLDGVRYREKRLKGIIGSDSVLKSFYKID